VRSAVPKHETRLEPSRKLTRVETILALQQATIFEHLDPDDLEALADLSEERTYSARQVAFEQGSPGDEMMLVVSGSAVVRACADDGSRKIAAPGPGEPVGDLRVLRGRPRMAEVPAGSGDLLAPLIAKMAERIALTVDPTGPAARLPFRCDLVCIRRSPHLGAAAEAATPPVWQATGSAWSSPNSRARGPSAGQG